MTRRLHLTRYQKAVAKLPLSEIKHLIRAQKIARGLTPGADWIVPRGKRVTKATAAIPYTRWKTAHAGMSPTKLATAHAAGEVPYKSAASAAQAEAQKAWRARIKRPKDFTKDAFLHTFIDRDGREWRELFFGRDLAIMQEYRRDWQGALRINDDALLKRYDRLKIYNTSGERVHPATKLDTIRNTRSRMSQRQRNRFDADLHYAHGEAQLAA